jgi:hypothetical protein
MTRNDIYDAWIPAGGEWKIWANQVPLADIPVDETDAPSLDQRLSVALSFLKHAQVHWLTSVWSGKRAQDSRAYSLAYEPH